MHVYIALQSTYDTFEMALFINDKQADQLYEDKRHTSSLLIPFLDRLLKKNRTSLSELSFCAINCGPGPFSTLRSIIASANGLHAATNIPLISVDGLDATFLEFYNSAYKNTVVLFNAFNNDVYYLIADHNKILTKGYKKIDDLLDYIIKTYPDEPINFIGNGVILHQNLIKQACNDTAIIKENMSNAFCSLKTIAFLGFTRFEQNKYNDSYLMPLYLKKHAIEI